jgi:hypothetical protein
MYLHLYWGIEVLMGLGLKLRFVAVVLVFLFAFLGFYGFAPSLLSGCVSRTSQSGMRSVVYVAHVHNIQTNSKLQFCVGQGQG